MVNELDPLYRALHCYKESLSNTLEKIDSLILDYVRGLPDSNNQHASSKKLKISTEMVTVLQSYVSMLHTCEVLSEQVSTILTETEHDVATKRDESIRNPFLPTPFKISCSNVTSTVIKVEPTSCFSQTDDSNSFQNNDSFILRSNNKPNSKAISQYDGIQEPNTQAQIVIPKEEEQAETCLQDLDQNDDSQKPSTCDETLATQKKNGNKSDPLNVSLGSSSDSFKYYSDLNSESDRNSNSSASDEHSADVAYSALKPHNDSMIFFSSDETEENAVSLVTKPKNEGFVKPSPFKETVLKPKPSPEECGDNYNTSVGTSKDTLLDSSEVNVSQNIEDKLEEIKTEVDRTEEYRKSRKTREFLSSLAGPAEKNEDHSSYENNTKEQRRQVTFNLDTVYFDDFGKKSCQSADSSIQKKKCKWKDVAPPQSDGLSVGQACTICHVISPSEFYVRNDQAYFETFERGFLEDMNKQHVFMVNKLKSKTEAKNYFGNYCCGFLSENAKWYRVEVLDWMEKEPNNNILVELIDYGEKCICTYKCLKPLTESYVRVPKMAVQCHLAGVHSTDIENKRKWPKSSIEFFKTLSKNTQFVTMFVYKERDSYAVDLRNESEPDADTLGKLLVLNDHASEVKLMPDDSQPCIKNTEPDTSVQILTKELVPSLTLPPSGQFVEVLLTSCVNTCHFYAHILRERISGNLFNDDFVTLTKTMQSYGLANGYKAFDDIPKIGELVLVQAGADWYRGCCLSYTNSQDIEIYVEDFGIKVRTNITHLRKIREELLSVPYQAVECVLFRYQDVAPRVKSEAFFNRVMKMRVFKGLVIKTGKPLNLQLWDARDNDMGVVLQQCGLAENYLDSGSN